MVVAVLVAHGDGKDALGQHRPKIVGDLRRDAGILDAAGHRVDQTDPLIDLTKQRRPGAGGQPATVEITANLSVPEPGKRQRQSLTLCHVEGLSSRNWIPFQEPILQEVRPSRHPQPPRLMQYPG